MAETRALSQIKRNERNSRTHGNAQIEQLERSLERFGWTFPVLLDEDDLALAGHGRLEAAERVWARGGSINGLDGEPLEPGHVPVLVARGWSEAQKRAYVVADNKIALNSDWDPDKLREELEAIGDDIDLSDLGFSEVELSQLFLDKEDGENDPDAEWVGMPEFNQQDKSAFRSIVVHFKDQAAVEAFFRKIKQKVTDKTRFVWFPAIEIDRYADKRYVSDDTPAAPAAPAAE